MCRGVCNQVDWHRGAPGLWFKAQPNRTLSQGSGQKIGSMSTLKKIIIPCLHVKAGKSTLWLVNKETVWVPLNIVCLFIILFSTVQLRKVFSIQNEFRMKPRLPLERTVKVIEIIIIIIIYTY